MHTNRLIRETSPYLLQHARNPVDWWPWGQQAIDEARRLDRLIFLSIGYSTCYWCHVMERESFESEDIARVLNGNFTCIKVDREERPDVDDIYMTAVQMMTGRGGWPMSMWLDPSTLQPVYGGTYFPPEPRHGMPSFPQVLEALSRAWKEDRENLVRHSDRIAGAVRAHASSDDMEVDEVGLPQVQQAVNQLVQMFDPEHGGFGSAPKFPQPVYLELLLEARDLFDDQSRGTLDTMIRRTLDGMAMGGMYDQAGGGFHRYSTDERWLVPHFEKMLYDNGQLATLYARASALYDEPYYARIARQTCAYVLREMTGDGGAFFSAQDAEVKSREGLNYLWTTEEVQSALNDAEGGDIVDLVIDAWGLGRGTNFRDPHWPEEPPRNVLFLTGHPRDLAEKSGMDEERFWQRIDRAREVLLRVRDAREQPATDDKVLTSWNGLMIAGLADAGRILPEPRFIEAAKSAARFILREMWRSDGTLLRTWRAGMAKIEGFLEDYTHLTRGLIALYRATGEDHWLESASAIMASAGQLFREKRGKAAIYYDARADQPDLFVRSRSIHDGAVPSGTGMALLAHLDLFDCARDELHLEDAAKALAGVSSAIRRNPLGPALSTIGLLRMATKHPDSLPRPEKASDAASVISAGPVTVTVDREEVRVTSERSDVITITLDIEPGFHINAHEPGDANLVGLLVHVAGGEGIIATAGYPQGEQWKDGVLVHTRSVQVPVSFERIGDVNGQPTLILRWQACSDTECLAPIERPLDVRLIVDAS